MQNKKGQELSTNTVIILVLAVLVLVFIIVGFSVGWNKIFPFISPPNNVKDVNDKCNLACSTQDTYGWCTSSRDVKLEQSILVNGAQRKEFSATCAQLTSETQYAVLGTVKCPAITCTPAP